ncbi:MAG TPA: prolipoprotein diacylglyceryl transferase [Roseiflexaceae bacterium]|jgi:phosphatidylglycerol:prolipoprotein diacylglycerol transferase
MIPIHPPGDPFLINVDIFGFPLQVRWYGVLIIGGAMLAAWLASRRAQHRGYDSEDVWNLLLLGLVLGIAGARAYYVAFEWERYAGKPLLEIINPQGGGLAIHGALIGAIAAALIYTRWRKLPFVEWLDICLPTVLVAQAVGRWGNFVNQEAYGRPTSLPFGVTIDQDHRLPPYEKMQEYPPGTLFHATFLYESIWNVAGFGLIVWLERRLKGWLRTGDAALFYAIWYGAGRFWVEGLRTDSLCTNGVGGACEGALRAAQVVSLLLFFGGLIGLYINHRRAPWASERAAAKPAAPAEDAAMVEQSVEQADESAAAPPAEPAQADGRVGEAPG